MILSNIWNNIVEWFSDRSERGKLVRSFNTSARDAFIQGTAPTLLKASISKGNREYRHQFSAWFNMDMYYNSDTFERLSNPATGLYYQSPGYVYDYLRNELATGKMQ